MVDRKKRRTLMLIGTGAVVSAAPAAAVASFRHGQSVSHDECAHLPVHGQCMEIRLELTVAQQPTLRISNDSDTLAVVRHVHPGIVHAGGSTFDVNSGFEHSAYAIGAGKSRTIAINPLPAGFHTERPYPIHEHANEPQRVARLRCADNCGQLVNSTRSFFG